MKFESKLETGKMVERVNRFTAVIDLDGRMVKAHIPTTGRLTELMQPGLECCVREVKSETRMTPYDLLLIRYKGYWVHINAITVNKLMVEVVANAQFKEFEGYDFRTEYTWGNSRFDLLLTAKRRKPVLMEVKSVTLCEDGIGMFPDAPTLRGVKHLRELEHSILQGFRAYAVFVAQRADAEAFRPNMETDPLFSRTLREVAASGVNVRAYRCRVDTNRIEISDKIPVSL